MRYILFSLALLLFSNDVVAQKEPRTERDLDVFWGAKQAKASKIARKLNFRPGDIIADIGTGSGWLAAAISMFADSVTFVLEDIDSTAFRQSLFDSALYHFSRKAGKLPLNSFTYAAGTECSSGLNKGTFNKVLLIDTYHHFTCTDKMLADITSLLKEGGQLLIVEAIARKPGDIHHGCRRPIFSEDEIISSVEAYGLTLTDKTMIYRTKGRRNMLMIFSRS